MVGVSYGGALALALGYCLGSIPFGLVLTRLAGAGDLRSIGSGNIGATNVLRTGRKGLAAATLVLDALKATAGRRLGLVGCSGRRRRSRRRRARSSATSIRSGSSSAAARASRPSSAGSSALLGRRRSPSPSSGSRSRRSRVIPPRRRWRRRSPRRSPGWRSGRAARRSSSRAVGADLVQAQRQHRAASCRHRDEDRAEDLERMANKPESRLTDEQRFDWLRLIRSENVGPRTFRALLTTCGGARRRWRRCRTSRGAAGAKRPIRVATVEEIERELIAARKLGVRFVALGEPDYPPAAAADRFRAADSRAPRPGGGAAAAGGRDRRLAQRLRRRARPSPSGWRAVWDRRATSSSRASRAGSTSAPMSRASRPARSACSPAAMASPTRARPCR